MARRLKAGDIVGGYTVIDLISSGGFALAYKARDAHGADVFLKQYKMPSVVTPWYRAYVAHQQELKRRIEAGRVRAYCYRFGEFFEAHAGHPCYFQTFEFVSHGHDLQGILDQMAARRSDVSWERRLILAKVLMTGIAALHEANVVHCDLKPANVQLFTDPEIKAGYVLKLIDMDFSILADRPAPWVGDREFGYVGSPGYQSPEHLSGATPTTASDVFTCGLMLYELLAGGHPYKFGDVSDYAKQVAAHAAKVPAIEGPLGIGVDSSRLLTMLHLTLSPAPHKRPTALELSRALLPAVEAPKVPPRKAEAPVREIAREPEAVAGTLTLVGAGGRVFLSAHLRTAVSGAVCRSLGHAEDAVYFDDPQYWVYPDGANWMIEPNKRARNETLVNGTAITTARKLAEGDVVGVGRQAKGISKLPLTVNMGRK